MKEKRVRIFLLHRRVLAVLCTLAVAAGIFYVTLYPASRTAAAYLFGGAEGEAVQHLLRRRVGQRGYPAFDRHSGEV